MAHYASDWQLSPFPFSTLLDVTHVCTQYIYCWVRCVCRFGVEVQIEHKKLTWALSLGLFPVSSSKEEELGASPRTQCYEETTAWEGRILDSTAKSQMAEAQRGRNAGGPKGGLNGMQSKELVERGETLNLLLLLSL